MLDKRKRIRDPTEIGRESEGIHQTSTKLCHRNCGPNWQVLSVSHGFYIRWLLISVCAPKIGLHANSDENIQIFEIFILIRNNNSSIFQCDMT